MSSAFEPIDFLIITALPEERDALLARLPGHRQLPPDADDINVYYRATLPFSRPDGSKGEYSVAVTFLAGMTRIPAAITASTAIRSWRPGHVLLVGIAAGFAQNGAAHGDVLISNQIVDYERQKHRDGEAQPRWQGSRWTGASCSHCLHQNIMPAPSCRAQAAVVERGPHLRWA